MWDANQRLVESHANGTVTRYGYDPLGRRLFKETGDKRTLFYWDGDALVGELMVTFTHPGESISAIERKALSITEQRKKIQVETPHKIREYVYYPRFFEPLALIEDMGNAQRVYHYHNDPNGCPTRLTNIRGEVKWAASYTVWGQISKLHINGVENPIRLQGQYFDNETLLHYNRFRYYLPSLGQYLSSDPLALFSQANTYTYCNGNPFIFVDPLGLECWSTAKKKFWKNEAIQNPNKYSPNNLARMKKGKAPMLTATVQDSLGNIKQVDVPMELHHTTIPQRVDGPNVHSSSNLTPLTPWGHEAQDSFRHTGQKLQSIDKGVDVW